MSDKSPTDEEVIQDGGQEPLPSENQDDSADEQTDAASGGERDAGQDSKDEPQDGTTRDEDGSSDDEGLAKFAKSQGIDELDSLTERERKLLKTAHDNQKAFRKERQDQSEDLKETVVDATTVDESELEDEDPDRAELIRTQAEIAQLRAEQRVTSFYVKNPEARNYDKEMGEIVTEEVKKHGKAAGRYLSSDLDRLLLLAKARRGDDSPDRFREDGRREERESLRRRQEGSAGTGQASSRATGNTKVTREWVSDEYDPGNPEHVELLDAAIQRGDLY